MEKEEEMGELCYLRLLLRRKEERRNEEVAAAAATPFLGMEKHDSLTRAVFLWLLAYWSAIFVHSFLILILAFFPSSLPQKVSEYYDHNLGAKTATGLPGKYRLFSRDLSFGEKSIKYICTAYV